MDSNLILIMVLLFIIAVVAIVVALNLIQNKQYKKIKKQLDSLEYEKNTIDSFPIVPELSKVESFLNNEKLKVLYKDWKERLEDIKSDQIPKITDMLLDADYSLSQMDYRDMVYKIAKLEMEIYKVRTNSQILLDEIKDITNSEEKHRAVITNLKTTYRELYQKFKSREQEYGDYAKYVMMQFENIAKRFEDFELIMENNEYTEVTQLINAIEEMLKHIAVVVEEIPSIVLLTTSILPKKIEEALSEYESLSKRGYPLDYLNVEYNVSEANKKINDIKDRCKVLNLEDSLFELKVLMDYFENLFTDFEKEKVNRRSFEELNNNFKNKLDKMNAIIDEMFAKMSDIKNLYKLSKDDINLLNEIKNELKALTSDYNILSAHTGNNTFAYSKLTKEVEALMVRLSSIEERLDNSLNTIGNMHDDELRARQQLDEIKQILKDAKLKMRDYKLPVIPNSYYVELSEASVAIKEIIKELEKKPITIEVLNTRVDTARDLVLKLYGKTKEMLKTARFAEMSIVYGNRYRSSYEDLNNNLTISEKLFYKGEYKRSLENTINILNKIEPGVYDKLLSYYSET